MTTKQEAIKKIIEEIECAPVPISEDSLSLYITRLISLDGNAEEDETIQSLLRTLSSNDESFKKLSASENGRVVLNALDKLDSEAFTLPQVLDDYFSLLPIAHIGESQPKQEVTTPQTIESMHYFQQEIEMFSHILPYELPKMFYYEHESDTLGYPPITGIQKGRMEKETSSVQEILTNFSNALSAIQPVLPKLPTAAISTFANKIANGFTGEYSEEAEGYPRFIKVCGCNGEEDYKFYRVTLAKEKPAKTSGLMPFILSPLGDEDFKSQRNINVYTVEYQDDNQSENKKNYPKEFVCRRMTTEELKEKNEQKKHKNVHVLFRGTADFSGARRDVLESHAGKDTLMEAYPYIQKCLRKAIKDAGLGNDAELINDARKIHLTISGHSLGGADTQNFATAFLMELNSHRKLKAKIESENNPQETNRKLSKLKERGLDVDDISGITINHNSTAPVTKDVVVSFFTESKDFLENGGILNVNIICRDGDPVPELGGVKILYSKENMEELLKINPNRFNVQMAKITHPKLSAANKSTMAGAAMAGTNALINTPGSPYAKIANAGLSAAQHTLSAAAQVEIEKAIRAHTAKIGTVEGEKMVLLNSSNHDDVKVIAEALQPGILNSATDRAMDARDSILGSNGLDITETLRLEFFDVQDEEAKERMIPSLPAKIMSATEEDIIMYNSGLADYLLAEPNRLIVFTKSEQALEALHKLFDTHGVDLLKNRNSALELWALIGTADQFKDALKEREKYPQSSNSRRGHTLALLCVRLANGEVRADEMIEAYINSITINTSWRTGTLGSLAGKFTGNNPFYEYTDVRGGPDNLTPMEYIARSANIELLKKLSENTKKSLIEIFFINEGNIISILTHAKRDGLGRNFVLNFLRLPDIQLLLTNSFLSKDEVAELLAKHKIEPEEIEPGVNIDKLKRKYLQYRATENLSNNTYLAKNNVAESEVDIFIEAIMLADKKQLIDIISTNILIEKTADGKTIVNLLMQTEDGKKALHKIAHHMKYMPLNVRNKLADIEVNVDGITKHFSYVFADSTMVMFRKHLTNDSKKEENLYQLVIQNDYEQVEKNIKSVKKNDVFYNLFKTETVFTLAAKQGYFQMFDLLVENFKNNPTWLPGGQLKDISVLKAPNGGGTALNYLCANLGSARSVEEQTKRKSIIQSIEKFVDTVIENIDKQNNCHEYTNMVDEEGLTPMQRIAMNADVEVLDTLKDKRCNLTKFGAAMGTGVAAHNFLQIFGVNNEDDVKKILDKAPSNKDGDDFVEMFCKIGYQLDERKVLGNSGIDWQKYRRNREENHNINYNRPTPN